MHARPEGHQGVADGGTQTVFVVEKSTDLEQFRELQRVVDRELDR